MIRKKSSKLYTGAIPFDLTGEKQLHYPESWGVSGNRWNPETKVMELTQEYIDSQEYGTPPKPQTWDLSDPRNKMEVNKNHWNQAYSARGIKWVDNYVFSDYLKFVDYQRGRSAAYVLWRGDKTGCEYTMFLKDLADLIKNKTISQGLVFSNWTFCKRGANYGIYAID